MRWNYLWTVLMGLAMALLGAAEARAGTVYFLVTEWTGRAQHNDSYVLPLTQADDIAHARELISKGPEEAGSAIVVAAISAGADGINRDWLKDDKPAWNWHVTQFEGFTDFTIEIYDGWPTFVEEDTAGWIANTNGRIGFWNYTVTRELGGAVAVPLPNGLAAGVGVMGGALALQCVARARRGRR